MAAFLNLIRNLKSGIVWRLILVIFALYFKWLVDSVSKIFDTFVGNENNPVWLSYLWLSYLWLKMLGGGSTGSEVKL